MLGLSVINVNISVEHSTTSMTPNILTKVHGNTDIAVLTDINDAKHSEQSDSTDITVLTGIYNAKQSDQGSSTVV